MVQVFHVHREDGRAACGWLTAPGESGTNETTREVSQGIFPPIVVYGALSYRISSGVCQIKLDVIVNCGDDNR